MTFNPAGMDRRPCRRSALMARLVLELNELGRQQCEQWFTTVPAARPGKRCRTGDPRRGNAIVRVDAVTICGTDLHILKGDVPEVHRGRILGHEAVGTVEEVGEGVHALAPGDRVLVFCISARGTCRFCREGRYGQCLCLGGWVLGHTIDGTQAEYVRVPYADMSTYQVPDAARDEEILRLADILPTGYAVGVLAGGVRPGDVVAVVGAGPVGLAGVAGAQLYSPGHVVAIDLSDARLEAAKHFGADVIVNNSRQDPLRVIRDLTGDLAGGFRMPSDTAAPSAAQLNGKNPQWFRHAGNAHQLVMAPSSPARMLTESAVKP